MSLCGRPPYQKGSAKKKSRRPTAAQVAHRERVRSLGCILIRMGIDHDHGGKIDTHHTGTGGGGRKNHDKLVPLCSRMHTGPDGIDGRKNISKIDWQERYATEDRMLEVVSKLLGY